MNIRQVERRVREIEQQRLEAAKSAERDLILRFNRASMGDTELDALVRPLAELQAMHGPDSPEAQAEYERIKAEFERIAEARYAWVLDAPIE